MTGVLGAFRNAIDKQTGFGVDAPTFVRQALIGAVGEQRADSIIGNVIDQDLGNGLSALKWMNAKSVAEVIKEHPQIIAMAFQLEPTIGGSDGHLADNLVPDVLMRLATLDSFALRRFESWMRCLRSR